MTHRHKRRIVQRTPSGPLWSCWCSCGWVCDSLTKAPHDKFQQHLREAGAEAADRLMREAPRGRRYA